MKKIYISIFACVCALTGFAQTATTDPGVVINGVTWATRNVDAPGTFAETPESAGMFYQWSRKTAWAATGAVSGWISSNPTSREWIAENDPSPAGWHIATEEEIENLLWHSKREWLTLNGVYGSKFTDTINNNSIFLPAAGYLGDSYGDIWAAGKSGHYWSSTNSFVWGTYQFYFDSIYYAGAGTIHRNYGYSIRCVKDKSSAIENVKADELKIVIENGELGVENYDGGTVRIFDVSGRTMVNGKLSNGKSIGISHLPAGIYIVKAGNHTKKIVKQ